MIRDGIRRTFRLALRGRRHWQRDVDAEIALHLELRVEQLIASGMSPADARASAERQFGGMTRGRRAMMKAAERRERRAGLLELFDDLRQDVRFALRAAGRQPAWTSTAVATLAIGIGAATSMFGIFSSLVLHAVPYPNADRVVVVEQHRPKTDEISGARMSILPPIMRAWRARTRSFDALEPFASGTEFITASVGDAIQAPSVRITSRFIALTGSVPLRGRMFTAEEQRDGARVAVLSEKLWRTRFGAADSVIGRRITVSDTMRVIVGVVPAGMKVVSASVQPDLWLPFDSTNVHRGVSAIGLLRHGVTASDAAAELDSIAVRSGVFPPGKLLAFSDVAPPAERLRFHDSLFMLGVAVALVLIVACGNTLHLLIARGMARQREFGVRVALGAGRQRLVRQLLTESLALTLAATLAGLMLGWTALGAVRGLRPSGLAELDAAQIDATTVAVVISLATLCAMVFGALASWQAMRGDARDRLRLDGGTGTSRSAERVRAGLVVAEIVASVALVVGATLLLRSMRNRQQTDLGFRPAGIWSVSLAPPRSRYDSAQSRAFIAEFASRLRAAPHVRGVAMSNVGVYGGALMIGAIEVEGEPPPENTNGFVAGNDVDASYFRMMGIPLLEGTWFTDSSAHSTQAIVTAAFAHAHWRAGTAVGHRFRVNFHGSGTWNTVVGVVNDALVEGPTLDAPAPLIYSLWNPSAETSIMFRVDPGFNPSAMVNTIAHAMDARLPRVFAGSMEASVDGALEGPRFTAAILTGFTAIALLLASVGLYGTLAYVVAQRTREIGIRMALGASAREIGRLVATKGMMLVATGVVLGTLVAHWATRFIQAQLFGVGALDLPSFAAGAGALFLAGAAACVVPTRRALSVDPMSAIRAE